MKLDYIDLNFAYKKDNGKEVLIKASISDEGNWQQWGADSEDLGVNVDLMTDIMEVVAPHIVEEEE